LAVVAEIDNAKNLAGSTAEGYAIAVQRDEISLADQLVHLALPADDWLILVACAVRLVAKVGNVLGRLGEATGEQNGSDNACMVGLSSQNSGGSFERVLVADQRRRALVGGNSDIFKDEGGEQEVVFVRICVEAIT
jgi:hypothetical protein